MTTLTIELPDETARLAAEKARQARMTLSEWLKEQIEGPPAGASSGGRDHLGYPTDWFERTAGSLADVEDFCEPADFETKTISPLDL